jgi:hypothetical protein
LARDFQRVGQRPYGRLVGGIIYRWGSDPNHEAALAHAADDRTRGPRDHAHVEQEAGGRLPQRRQEIGHAAVAQPASVLLP